MSAVHPNNAQAPDGQGGRDQLGVLGSESLYVEAGVLSTGNAFGRGIAAPTYQGSSGVMIAAEGVRWERRSTGTTLGAQSGPYGVAGSALVWTTDVDWTVWFQFYLDSALTNYCIYWGVCATQPTYSSTTPPQNSVLARYVQGTDEKFTALGRGTGSASAGDAFGPDVAASTAYTGRIRHVAGDAAYFGIQTGLDLFGDFGTEVRVTTLPASSVSMGWACQAGAYTAGTSRDFAWRRLVTRFAA